MNLNAAMKMVSSVGDFFARFDETLSRWLLPTLARLVFAGVLLVYFWGSALTKLGDGIFGFLSLSLGAYVQIFPKAMENAGYDPSQLSIFHDLIAVVGTNSEFVLPFLILIGCLTRISALGMIGFILVQSIVDIYGHGLGAQDIGAWFDRASGALIADQRAFWIFLLIVLVVKGPGPISVDHQIMRMASR